MYLRNVASCLESGMAPCHEIVSQIFACLLFLAEGSDWMSVRKARRGALLCSENNVKEKCYFCSYNSTSLELRDGFCE